MNKIAFLCPYFGTLPAHTRLWLNSCALNPEVTWFLYTDDKTPYDYPENVVVEYTTLRELKERFQKKFDFEIALPDVKKLGDYKPLFGYLFEEQIEGYAAWGHIDVADEIYGNIRAFVTDEALQKYDKLMLFGHMSIYRNSPEVNRRFMAESGTELNYRKIFSSDEFYNFEEIAHGSIADIYKYNNWEIGRFESKIADLRCIKFHFEFGTWSDDLKKYTVCKDKQPCVFAHENGGIYCYYVKNNLVLREEFIYVHFKRRKMNIEISQDTENYLIIPSGFVPMRELTPEYIRKVNREKPLHSVYLSNKLRGLRNKFKKN